MEKMPGHPRLYRRGATYYHRAAIPVDIKATYPKTEETFSLKTTDYQDALKLVRKAGAEVDDKFESHRRALTLDAQPPLLELSDAKITQLGDLYYASLLEEDEETRVEGFYEEDAPILELPVPTFDEYTENSEALDDVNRHNSARGKIGEFFVDEADDILSWENVNIRLAPNSLSRRKLARALQAATIRANEATQARNRGDVIETPKVEAPSPASDTPLLSIAVEGWAKEKSRTKWVAKTEREHRVWMGHFLDIAGDKPLSAYNKANGRAFKAMLMSLPANWNKHGALKNLPIEQAASKASELGMKPMSDRNVNKLIGFVSSFWSWAHGKYDDEPANPLRGMKLEIRKNPRDERDPFTDEELRTIFNAPIYTGCRSLRHWNAPGNQVLRESGIYWVPLIGLYTGAREGEIIQLYVEDIREKFGVLHFDLNTNGEDKRLKTASSRRQIPVHDDLIAMGLLEHIELRRSQGQTRLFSDLPMGADGYYSSPFSKHYRRFLISLGIKRQKNSFHSFRHSFEDVCRDCDISVELTDSIQGHGEDGMRKRYGDGHRLRKLGEAMKKIQYRDLDLSHLHAIKA